MSVNWKGILTFLAITFGLTYAVEFAIIAAGVRFDATPADAFMGQIAVMIAMWFPALGAFLTVRFVTHEDADRFGLRLGAIRPYLIWVVVMPVLFAVIYGLSWALGLAQPDFAMSAFLGLMEAAGADISTAPPTSVLIPVLFLASAITAPFVNTLFALGEEIGWRGYLLPRLIPLGKPTAYAIGGMVWALWHAPIILIGFTYPGYPVLGILAMIVLASAINVIENEAFLRYGNTTLLAAWIHGLFNSQKLGLWGVIFVGINPLIGGYAGLIGMVVFWIVAGIVMRLYSVQRHPVPSSTSPAAA